MKPEDRSSSFRPQWSRDDNRPESGPSLRLETVWLSSGMAAARSQKEEVLDFRCFIDTVVSCVNLPLIMIRRPAFSPPTTFNVTNPNSDGGVRYLLFKPKSLAQIPAQEEQLSV